MEKLWIKVGARASSLSKAQVQEVLHEIQQLNPQIEFECIYQETTGDKDRLTSLRTLGKTDFFTKEIDDLLLKGGCRIAIHSAKDLPEPIPNGLALAAITHGMDSADVVILRSGENFHTLPPGAKIATSSHRREELVKQLRKDLTFCDLRGTIEERLALLDQGQADGIVVAEAALIRLGLTHLNRMRLEGETVPNQGRLAILCRTEDSEMLTLFRCLDSRQKDYKILYLGLDLPKQPQKHQTYIHYPIIRIHVRPSDQLDIQEGFKDIPAYTHLLFTSKSAVHAFFKNLSHFGFKVHHLLGKETLCVGQETVKTLKAYGVSSIITPAVETSEGLIELMKSLPIHNPYFFWPHSALSRTVVSDFLKQMKWRFKECMIYDTVVNKSLPSIDLSSVDEIYFTSPSTIDAFQELFGHIPKDKVLKAIGAVTEQKLTRHTVDA
jgi:hydroxymethylbilane synthase